MAIDVGVLLPQPADPLGEWLATGAAFDAAGAAALWLDIVPGPDRDPLVLAAALAATTGRTLLVLAVPPDISPRTHELTTLGRLSRGRLKLLVDGEGATTAGFGVFRRIPGDPPTFHHESGSWVPVAVPDGRESWRASLAAVADSGTRGLVVPADPRVLDLLRNPDDPGQRRDLELAVG